MLWQGLRKGHLFVYFAKNLHNLVFMCLCSRPVSKERPFQDRVMVLCCRPWRKNRRFIIGKDEGVRFRILFLAEGWTVRHAMKLWKSLLGFWLRLTNRRLS